MKQYSCRLMEDSDIDELVALSSAKSRQVGYESWLPPLREPATKLVFVLSDGEEMLGALVVREIHEVSFIGISPELVLAVEQYAEKMKAIGRRRGITDLVGFVPKAFVQRKSKSAKLAGLMQAFERLKFRVLDRFVAVEGSTLGEV